MRRLLRIARREYAESVKTKSFIITIFVVPLFMFGSLIAIFLLRDQVDLTPKTIAVIDHGGDFAPLLQEAVKLRNETEIYDKETGKQTAPEYRINVVEPGTDIEMQRVELSNRVRSRDLAGFVEIGSSIINPEENAGMAWIHYFSDSGLSAAIPGWIGDVVNARIREQRMAAAGLDQQAIEQAMRWMPVESLGLVSQDERTGEVKGGRQLDRLTAFLVPYISVMMLFGIIMMATMPLANAGLEEKIQGISEVLLGAAQPFEILAGKLLGNGAVALTTFSVYLAVGYAIAAQQGFLDLIPFHVLPWFFFYAVAAVAMHGGLILALVSACNDIKESQSAYMPVMAMMMVPMFVMVPIIQEPMSTFSTVMSFIPPFTPLLMLARLAQPGSIPLWQPVVSGILMAVYALFVLWLGGRIYRVVLLVRGKKPGLLTLIRWGLRG